MLRTPAAAVGGLLAIGFAACGSSSTSTSSPAGGGSAAITVTAHDFSFDPVSAAVSPSGTVNVTFMNAGKAEHSFTLDSGGTEVEGEAGTTKTVSFTAPASGDIKFHCKYHASMHGIISTGAAGAGGSSTSSSSGYGY